MEPWTEAETAWLREHYAEGTINDTLAAMEREFGRTHGKRGVFVKAHKLGLTKARHSAERYQPAQVRVRWSEPAFAEMREWMLENDTGESVFGTIDAFEKEFGVRMNRSQVSRFRSTYGTSRRKSHGGGKPNRPVGSERTGKDGYIMVKVKEWPDVPCTKDNWRFKHHVVWEQANGRELPEGWTVFFADRDTRNFDPANLVALPRTYIGMLNNPGLPCSGYTDADTLRASIAWCDLHMAVRGAEMGLARTCGVCGRPFRPTDKQQKYTKPVQTCPDCLAAGHKSKGRRGKPSA